jgi:hypothetical protein
MGGTSAGVCLHINSTAATGGLSWRVEENGTLILASGELNGSAASLSVWRTLELAFGCSNSSGHKVFTASIDGVVVGAGKTNTTAGMAALSSGWHLAEFDRFKLDAC